MPTTRYRSLRILQQSGAFGSPQAGDVVPGGVDWSKATAVPVDAADLTLPGEVRQTDTDLAKASDYMNPVDADMVDEVAGDRHYHRPGQLSFNTRVDGVGSLERGVFHPDLHWLYTLIASVMADMGTSKTSTGDSAVTITSPTVFEVADASGYQPGDVVLYFGEAARILSIDTNTITHTGLVGLTIDGSAITIDRLHLSDTVSAVGTTSTFTATAGTGYVVGKMIKVVIDGLARYLQVLEVDGTTITHTALPLPIPQGTAVRHCRTFHVNGNGASFDARVDTRTAAAVLYGCRVTQITAEVAGDGMKMQKLGWTIQVAQVEFDHANAAVIDPPDILGRPANFLGADRWLSAALPVLATVGSAAYEHQLDVDGLNFSLQAAVAAKRHHRDLVGMSDLVVNRRDVSLDLKLSESVPVGADKAHQRKRHLSIGWGPSRPGEGMCIFVPASHELGDPDLTDLSGDINMTNLKRGNFRAMSLDGDTAAAEASLVLAFAE